MLNFKKISWEDAPILRSYYENCDYILCEYSVGTKLMWNNTLSPEWTEAAGCLIVKSTFMNHIVFDYPVAGPEGDVDGALLLIERYCMDKGVPLALSVVPEIEGQHLIHRYPYVNVSAVRTWKDYVYESEKMQNFAGRKYSGQRNHIKKFKTAYPEAVFREITPKDNRILERFWYDYQSEFKKSDDPKAVDELNYAKQLFGILHTGYFRAGGYFIGDKLISLALAEKCGNTLIIHIEKALYSYEGVYPAMVQAFAQMFGKDVLYLNREDDAADRGLRTSKTQYRPAFLANKYAFEPRNDLAQTTDEVPTITTERLVLDEIGEGDIPAYNELVLDRDRNVWWGYDDVAGLGGPVKEDSFYLVAKRDFEKKYAVNFAVRLNGRMIGEAVLYDFDYRGGAELGCRILKEYAGNGYGTEAFAAVADWALYTIHMTRVIAKCYKENEASYKMLSSCMRKISQDDTFYYFEKTV